MDFPSDEDRKTTLSPLSGRRSTRQRRAIYGSSAEKRRHDVVDDLLKRNGKPASPTFDDAAWKASTTASGGKAKARLSFGGRRKKSRYQTDDSDDNEILSDVDSKKSGISQDERTGSADQDDTIRLSSPVKISTAEASSPDGFGSNVSPLRDESTPPVQDRRLGRRRRKDEADPDRPKKKVATDQPSKSAKPGDQNMGETSASKTAVEDDDDDDALMMEPVFGSSSKKSDASPRSDIFQRSGTDTACLGDGDADGKKHERGKKPLAQKNDEKESANPNTSKAPKNVQFSEESAIDEITNVAGKPPNNSTDQMNQQTGDDKEEDRKDDGDDATHSSVKNVAAETSEQEDLLLTVRSELENMGKALRCPLCLRTMRNPSLLPCLHAFCHGCIVTSLEGGTTTAMGRKRRWTNNNGEGEENTFAGQCPCCKVKCTKRGLVPSENLADQVAAYKRLVHAFGMAPVVQDESVAMTQMEDLPRLDDFRDDEFETQEQEVVPLGNGESVLDTEGVDTTAGSVSTPPPQEASSEPSNSPRKESPADTKRKSMEPSTVEKQEQKKKSRKSKPTMQECHEHLEVSRTMHIALKAMAESTAKRFGERASESQKTSEDEADNSTGGDGEKHAVSKVTNSRRRGRPQNTGDSSLGSQEKPRSRRHLPRTAKDFERMNEMRRLEMLVKEQERVLKTDEKALIRSAVSTQKKNARRSFARSSLVSNDASTSSPNGKAQVGADSEDKEAIPSVSTPTGTNEPGRTLDEASASTSKGGFDDPDKNAMDESFEDETQILGDETAEKTDLVFPGERMTGDSPGPRRQSQNHAEAGLVEQVIETRTPEAFGTNERRKSHGSRSSEISENSFDILERSMNEARENEAADRSGEFALEADRLEPEERQNVAAVRVNESLATLPGEAEDTVNQRRPQQHMPSDSHNPATTNPSVASATLAVGNIVSVQSRTWPGVNKPGGVGKILRVHTDSESGTRYDVAYVLGGKERNVDSSFVQLEQDVQDALTPTNSARHSVGSESGTDQSQQSVRRKSRRSADKENDPPWLKDIIASVAAETRMEPKAPKRERDVGGKKRKGGGEEAAPAATKMKVASANKKRGVEKKATVKEKKKTVGRRVLAEKKRKKPSQEKTSESSSGTPDSLDDVKEAADPEDVNLWKEFNDIRSLSTEERSRLAAERRKLVLSGAPGKPKSKKACVYLVPSGVSEHDKGLIRILCDKVRKSSGVSCKLAKDFSSQNATICITPHKSSAGTNDDDAESSRGDFSRLRTVKVMRAALMGIPILTPQWVEACVQKSEIVAATGSMCIRSLPTKADELMGSDGDGPCAVDGVTLYSCFFQQRMAKGLALSCPFPLLSNVSVLLCGAWEKGQSGPLKADVQSLLGESHANLLTSIGMTTAKLRELGAKGCEEKVVLLCDESATCGISETLAREFRSAVVVGRCWVVNAYWLFDCISCGAILDGDLYEPSSPRAKELWRLCLGKEEK